ncbi:MAG: class I SAM-dependent methyltransferase [Ignavibacteria bacterium]
MTSDNTLKEQLKKESEDFINLHFWDTYYYSSNLLRKRYEENIPIHLNKSNKNIRYLITAAVSDLMNIYSSLFKESYTGIDVGENAHADVIIDPDGRIPFQDGEFDVVLSSQVLEHVEDSDNYLSECRRVLKPGGLLILSTHGTWQFHSHPVDIQRWTSMGLKRLITKAGFNLTGFDLSGTACATSQLRLTFYDSFVNIFSNL